MSRSLIVGNTGCGKSRLSKQLLKNCNRLVFIDPQQEWGEECEAVLSWEGLLQAVRKPRFRVAIWIDFRSDGLSPEEYVDTVISVCQHPDVTNCVLAIDELSWFFPSGDTSEAVEALFRFGRRQRVHFWGISQRYVDCPIIARSQSTDLYCFRTHEKADIDRLGSMIPGGRKVAELVQGLPDGEFFHWNLTARTDPKRGKVDGFQQYRGNHAPGFPGGRDRQQDRDDSESVARSVTDDSDEPEEEQ